MHKHEARGYARQKLNSDFVVTKISLPHLISFNFSNYFPHFVSSRMHLCDALHADDAYSPVDLMKDDCADWCLLGSWIYVHNYEWKSSHFLALSPRLPSWKCNFCKTLLLVLNERVEALHVLNATKVKRNKFLMINKKFRIESKLFSFFIKLRLFGFFSSCLNIQSAFTIFLHNHLNAYAYQTFLSI